MLTLVTSINQKLFKDYGRRFIESWGRHAGDGVRLVVCAEGNIEGLVEVSRPGSVVVCSLESEAQNRFRRKFGRFFQAAGGVPVRSSQSHNGFTVKYNYRFDALRFSFKAFSYHRAFHELGLDSEFVGWIDSDVVCLRDFNLTALTEVLPQNGEVASYLGRSAFPKPMAYSECGFVAFDYTNVSAREFLAGFVSMYETGDIFLNAEWHDCVAFDVLRGKYEASGSVFRDISGVHHAREHPFVLSPLGKFFDHLKGPRRKIAGRSLSDRN
jgi:hypothetical protein